MNNQKFSFYYSFLVFFLFLAIIGWGLGKYYQQQIYIPVDAGSHEIIEFVVTTGESGSQVGRRLRELGLIRSDLWFRLYLRLNQVQGAFLQAGSYQLSASMSLAQILEEFSHGTFDLQLTFIEGWRREEYAAYLGSKFDQDFAQKFLVQAKDHGGYLFPDTYLVQKDVTPSDLIVLLTKTFEQKIDANLKQGFEKQSLSLEQAVVLASIVEREAKLLADRPQVAGILIKRFLAGWPLEADATVQYAKANLTCSLTNLECDWWPKDLGEEDLKIDSPYNTRLHPGLPPAPIAYPGLTALKAVSEPEDTPDWYYLSDQQGNIHYAKTLEEHQQNIQTYLQ